MILRLLPLLFSLLALCSCGNLSGDVSENPQGEISIAHLKSLCKGDSYHITSDCLLRGIVVASDWLGELYKSVIIRDESGGIEILVDSHDIHATLPIYSEVEVHCNGLKLARIGEKVEMGALPTGNFPLNNIPEAIFDRYFKVIGMVENIEATTKRIAELEHSDISNIIRLEGVRIGEAGEQRKWCDEVDGKMVTTYRTLIDNEGDSLALCIYPTCRYADRAMPENEISVIGAIDYADDRYFIHIVNRWITQ